jgi:hypothetical protein
MIVALGCKNTFTAVVPAQCFLRVAAANDNNWRQAWRKHGRSACVLALTLLLPLAHFLWFKHNWHPGQYEAGMPSLTQLGRIIWGLKSSVGLDFTGIGLLLTIITLVLSRKNPMQRSAVLGHEILPWRSYAPALAAGGLLLFAGAAVYLPMNAMSGRYTVPVVWGLDIVLGVLLSRLIALPRSVWRQAAAAALVCGLVAVAVAGVGQQEKFAARAGLLWQALHWTERHAPIDARIAWVGCLYTPGVGYPGARDGSSDQRLDTAEGVHFAWHLRGRGHTDFKFGLLDENGQPVQHPKFSRLSGPPDLVVTSKPVLPPTLAELNFEWHRQAFSVQYRFGKRRFDCYVWTRVPTAGRPPVSNSPDTYFFD